LCSTKSSTSVTRVDAGGADAAAVEVEAAEEADATEVDAADVGTTPDAPRRRWWARPWARTPQPWMRS
jgi:hypothetical protein